MKIICVGRNYAAHAIELGNEVPKDPVIFLKPDSSILPDREPFFIPDFSNDIHYETEMVIKINRLGKNIEEKFAHKYYNEFTLGIDFTARDLQNQLKEKGLPWELSKGFDRSAVVGTFLTKKGYDLSKLKFAMQRNGIEVQSGDTSLMLHSVDKIIAFVSRYYTLKIGDLIYTGTPAGVGPVEIGDVLVGFVGEKVMFNVRIK